MILDKWGFFFLKFELRIDQLFVTSCSTYYLASNCNKASKLILYAKKTSTDTDCRANGYRNKYIKYNG